MPGLLSRLGEPRYNAPMRRLVPLVLLALVQSAMAQKPLGITPAKADRSLKSAMLSELADPKTQVAIGVTSTQRSLMELRLTERATNMSLDLVRASLSSDTDRGVLSLTATFEGSTAKALYPFLASNQIAKLRRLTLVHQPLAALGTDEVAFALSLTDAQRAHIESIRAKQAQAALDPKRPSVRFLTAAIARLQKASAKLESSEGDDEMTVEKLDAARPLILALFRDMETTSRLATKEPAIKAPSPLALLTQAQRRRYRELSTGTPLVAMPSRRVAKRS